MLIKSSQAAGLAATAPLTAMPITTRLCQQPSGHANKGLTLIELMLICNLLALLVAIGWPALQEMLARQRAESYLRQFKQQLSFARITAITSGRTVTLCPRLAEQCLDQWWQLPIQILQQNVNSGQLTLLQQLPRPADQHWFYYNRAQLQFRQDGSLNALQNGTFIYCAGQYRWHYSLSLSQTGRSQLTFQPWPCPR